MSAVVALDRGISWLLDSDEPIIRWRALIDLVGAEPDDPRAVETKREIPNGRIVRSLLAGQEDGGGFGRHYYSKWRGGHWRLVSLMDLGAPPDLPGAAEALEPVLRGLTGKSHLTHWPLINGRARRCASVDGNALAAAVRFGAPDDPRIRVLAGSLVAWQWPDGGWNCDRKPDTTHSSVNESLAPLRGLAAFARMTGDAPAAAAADRAAEFFLRHRLAYSERTGRPIHPVVVRIQYPPYWHYDFMAALRVFAESGYLADPRTADALDLLESKRSDDGTWSPDAVHFKGPNKAGSLVDVIDWGKGPSEPVTLGALLVLKAAGRL